MEHERQLTNATFERIRPSATAQPAAHRRNECQPRPYRISSLRNFEILYDGATLDEEKSTDQKLSQIVKSRANRNWLGASAEERSAGSGVVDHEARSCVFGLHK